MNSKLKSIAQRVRVFVRGPAALDGAKVQSSSVARLWRCFLSSTLLGLCVALTGCISTEKALLPLQGEDQLVPSWPLRTACDSKNFCQHGWLQNSGVKGVAKGGPVDGNRDFRDVSFHRLDGEHHIVQIIQTVHSGTYHQYVLLRNRGGSIHAYSLELEKFNPKYLEEQASAGGIVDTTTDLRRKVGMRTWKVTTREALVRLFKSASGLSHEELSRLGGAFEIDAMSKAQMIAYVAAKARQSAEVAIDIEKAPSDITVSQFPASSGCPTVLPGGVTCTEYTKPRGDLHPQLEQEVIYLSKYGCVHCKNVQGYVAKWQMSAPEVNFYYSSVIDWTEPTPNIYDVERVPSFVVNRRFLVSLESSNKQTVEYALGLVSSLARAPLKR